MKISVKRFVQVETTADDWGLYDTEDREIVAKELGSSFSFYATSHNKVDCRRLMVALLEHYAQDGAADTEGYNTLENLLDYVYGA